MLRSPEGFREPLKIPAYQYIDMDTYRRKASKASMEVIRGCPNHCKFCLNGKFYSSLRYKPIPVVVKEIELLIGQYGFSKLSIISPQFISNVTYTKDLCEALRVLLGGSSVTWACTTTADSLSPDILTLMSKAHCRSVFVGVDTADISVGQLVSKAMVGSMMLD